MLAAEDDLGKRAHESDRGRKRCTDARTGERKPIDRRRRAVQKRRDAGRRRGRTGHANLRDSSRREHRQIAVTRDPRLEDEPDLHDAHDADDDQEDRDDEAHAENDQACRHAAASEEGPGDEVSVLGAPSLLTSPFGVELGVEAAFVVLDEPFRESFT